MTMFLFDFVSDSYIKQRERERERERERKRERERERRRRRELHGAQVKLHDVPDAFFFVKSSDLILPSSVYFPSELSLEFSTRGKV